MLSIHEIDKDISDCQDTLSSLHRSHPLRFTHLTLLGMMRYSRYALSDDERDLNSSILQFTESIFLPFQSSNKSGIKLTEVVFYLARALHRRSHKSKEQSDIRSCSHYLHYLRNRSFEAFGVPYNDVTTLLVDVLGLQLQLEPAHASQHVEEMSTLCHELLASDVKDSSLNQAMEVFASVVTRVIGFWNPPSQQLIECLREANKRLPYLHEVSMALSWSLLYRSQITLSNDDLEDAMATVDKVIASQTSTSSPSPYMSGATCLAAMIAYYRSTLYRNPEYSEEASFRIRDYLKIAPPEDPRRPAFIESLKMLERTRSNEFGIVNSPREALSRASETVDMPSFSQLAASLAESKSNTVNSLSMTTADRNRHLSALGSIHLITDTADVEEVIKYCELLLSLLPPTDHLAFMAALKLGEALHHMFRHSNNTEYLNASIAVRRDILEMPDARWSRFVVVVQLALSLFSRFLLSNDRKDFDEFMQLLPIAADDTFAGIPYRFQISCRWAWAARASWHPSTSVAYRNAISLMHESIEFAPTLEIQHFRLVTMRDEYEKLPLNYASYQVHIGQLTEAIATLEQGRGLLWSEMRGLRTSAHLLRKVDSPLAEKFAAINRDLEALTTSGSPSAWINGGKVNGADGVDSFGQLVVKQRNLVQERDRLISQIRALPGFETFMTAPSFNFLHPATAHGPVIIINHCKWRSDIIILLYDHPPSLISTTDDFYDRAISLRDQLLAARKEGLDSEEYNDALISVLTILYDIVGRPVIQRLRQLNVPEQSRIWWCPTSAFCSLPLHAMGPIQSDGPAKLYFSDLYIPSYTPTLSALIEARRPGTRTFDRPSILLVVQPDAEMPNSLQEMRVIQSVTPSVTTLLWETAKPTSALEHLEYHRFAHFSCHGKLEKGKPFDASFKLYEGARLTLLELVRSQLPTAEFAFLSACHTAELTEESIADEALHLTAAVQYCGFRSVVGTMWEMADIDGPDLVGNFYRSAFSDRHPDLPYYERTAEALRDAVRNLRRKRNITLERWVNFVHYGA